jgi:alkanesulfonate monooxygenase SsuD/methylene tetrahydromethanopterin reductase-like flavin-dependent oxidoreductase (luciferase family)
MAVLTEGRFTLGVGAGERLNEHVVGQGWPGVSAARLAAGKADGLIVTEPEKDLVKAFTKAGGKGPRYCEVALCCAADEEQARKTAHSRHRWSLAGWPVLAELPHEEAFAAASEHISLEAIDEFVAIGCDHIILTQIGPDQDFFFDLFERKLAPALRAMKAA